MTALRDELQTTREQLVIEQGTGAWRPAVGDVLAECDFVKVGFRAWGLEASDKSWRLDLSRLDFGDSNPSALLTVTAPNHANAFGDLNWFVFSHSIGVNGGTNYNQCVARLSEMLGGSKVDWARRIVYLIAKAKQVNAGASNGTFSTTGAPIVATPPPFVFGRRVREGRTMSIFGPGSAGKTTIVDGLVASACSGVEIIPSWRPSRRYSCLLLDWDEGREEEEVRLSAVCRAYEIELTAGYHYKRMARPLHDVADEIGAYIVAHGVEIVVVSPVGRAIRDHGDNITAPIDELYEILRSFATTNILIDHVTGANIKGGAEREFGAVRKRDNVRGSYSLYAQSEGTGERVVVLRQTKADPLSPKVGTQAVRIEYDPADPEDGIYDRISYHADEVTDNLDYQVRAPVDSGTAMRVVIHKALLTAHMKPEQLAEATGHNTPSIRTTLNRYKGSWFNLLPSGAWEALPLP